MSHIGSCIISMYYLSLYIHNYIHTPYQKLDYTHFGTLYMHLYHTSNNSGIIDYIENNSHLYNTIIQYMDTIYTVLDYLNNILITHACNLPNKKYIIHFLGITLMDTHKFHLPIQIHFHMPNSPIYYNLCNLEDMNSNCFTNKIIH
mmetsp:Transcript_16954/g.2790  ORF Transcript_16954/g.2790 Transcript_16954/m.2790 type:complete len:146 (+) Transcript_16954:242-679(+)